MTGSNPALVRISHVIYDDRFEMTTEMKTTHPQSVLDNTKIMDSSIKSRD